MFTQAKHFLAIIAQWRSQGLPCLCQPGWAELTDWQEEGGGKPSAVRLATDTGLNPLDQSMRLPRNCLGFRQPRREGSFSLVIECLLVNFSPFRGVEGWKAVHALSLSLSLKQSIFHNDIFDITGNHRGRFPLPPSQRRPRPLSTIVLSVAYLGTLLLAFLQFIPVTWLLFFPLCEPPRTHSVPQRLY